MPAPRPFTPLAQLAQRAYEVVIVGGGINGAAIARLAALRGRKVLLLEAHDYGWGTTWRSTKLIHGGLRYLEHAEFALVFESLHDQATLLRAYPDMVRPLELLLPVFLDDRHRPRTIGLGLSLYDALALGRGLPRHQRLSAEQAWQLEPALRRAGLTAAFRYYDCQAAYPERLCLQTLQEARACGAEAASRAHVVGLLCRFDGSVRGVRVHDAESGALYEVASRVVVNAAGPWIDELLQGAHAEGARQVGGTKGAHLVVDYSGRGPRRATYAEARADHRPFFIVPWRGKHLVGTTDTLFDGKPSQVRATAADITYLLHEANALLPHAPLAAEAVEYAYAGVRPLPASDGDEPGAITRRHIVRDHATSGHAGLISIVGGKLSTFRSLARATMPAIDRYLDSPSRRISEELPFIAKPALLAAEGLPPATLDYLRQMYGPAFAPLAELLHADPALRAPLCEHGPDVAAQLVFAARHEGVRTLADALLRRTGVGWNRCHGLHRSEPAAALLARELGWDAQRQAREVDAFAAEVAATFTRPAAEER